MRLEREYSCDVLVFGSGIAGITAALEAAEMGRTVILACKGKLFSGSSFYPGTWGLGLVGAADASDMEDLVGTIQAVGCGMADPVMVHTFVEGIGPAIDKLRSMGIQLRRADNGTQKEFIPCFDHKHRDWNGIEFDSARAVYSQRLAALGVTVLPNCEALELIKTDGRVCGAVVAKDHALRYIASKTVILATGGYGSIFKYHLCTEDVEGIGQHLALEAGCRLVNMEFMQMMPGYVSPAFQTIFNEKVFRFTRLHRPDGTPLLGENAAELLDIRSTHGPFTSRLPSKEVDIALFRAFLEDERGVEAAYTQEMRRCPPEFVTTYFDWLLETRGLTMDHPIQIGMFAHAANGGIQIDANAFTGVPGLFAAGEVTGGMHGADRIGGLSTANGLVFGGTAGRSAAAACAELPAPPQRVGVKAMAAREYPEAMHTLQDTMFRHAMIERSETGLMTALGDVAALKEGLSLSPATDVHTVAQARRLIGRLRTAECVLKAALLRRESRGAHYRADYPVQSSDQAVPIIIENNDGIICPRFSKEEAICP